MTTTSRFPLAARAAQVLIVAAAVSLAACAGGPPPPPRIAPEQIPFAAALDVDFARMTKSPTGLYTRDLTVGTGPVVQKGQTVSVWYTGWLSNGVEFDRTPAGSKPISFKITRAQVIPGWDEGILGMRVGGRRQLVVPPELGYGSDRKGAIPGDATLVFVVEVTGTKP